MRWGGGAGVGRGVDDVGAGAGEVVAGSYCGVEGFQQCACFGVEVAAASAHAVGALCVDGQAALSGAVGVVKSAVGIDGVGDAGADGGDEVGVLGAGVVDEGGFDGGLLVGGDRGEFVEGLADGGDVVLAEGAGGDGVGEGGEFGGDGGAGDRSAGVDAGGEGEAAGDLARDEAQSGGEGVAEADSWSAGEVVVAVGWVGHLGEDAVGQGAGGAVLVFEAFGHLDAEGVAHHVG